MAKGQINVVESLVGYDWEPVASGLLAAGVCFAIYKLGLGAMNRAKEPLIPDEKMSFRNLSELLAEFIMGLGDGIMGKHNRKYLPFICTLFLYVLVMNLMGLVPGFSGPTDEIPRGLMFNAGIALTVFFLYNFWGIKEVGFKNYLKHFLGPVPAIAPLLFLIEIISHMFRPLTLSVRLAGNMTADHTVLSTFIDLTKVVIPVIFYGLGTFVSFIQAFVFTMLTMLYIGLATAHEEH